MKVLQEQIRREDAAREAAMAARSRTPSNVSEDGSKKVIPDDAQSFGAFSLTS